jgi:hypothetical protein
LLAILPKSIEDKILDTSWEEGFEHLEEFVLTSGNAEVPSNHVCEDGYNLGRWVDRQRSFRNSLTNEQKSKLEAFKGWIWNPRDLVWEEGFEHLEEYVAAEGDASVPHKHISPDGYNLWRWVERQRIARKTMDPNRARRLEAVKGWVWQERR